ncbi:MAG TPA: DUF1284 domain-containing protein [Candidatus Woesearchaeota archaeon]|nr:DUF1284 domain-containing protein [Candidatus Woesearchaeota archaeon]
MEGKISLRAHHIARFAEYYLEHRQVRSNYGDEFRSCTSSLYDRIIRREASRIEIIDGLDDVCQVCIKTTKRKQPSCEKGDELQRDPSALLAMAKSQLVVGQTYKVGEFLRRVERIGEKYPQEKLLEMIRSAYCNMQGTLQPTP